MNADAFLSKPASAKVLIGKIRELLGRNS